MYIVTLINASGYIVNRSEFETIAEARTLAADWTNDYPGHDINVLWARPLPRPTWDELCRA